MKKVIFIKPSESSFIRKDEEILRDGFEVTSLRVHQNQSKIFYFFSLLLLFFRLIFCRRSVRIFITWFGDYHAAVMVLAARIRGKKSVIFAGGQEAVCYPELRKGVYLKKFRGRCVAYALQNASLIIPNHESLIYHENKYYQPGKVKVDGIKHYVKNFKTPYVVIPNGIDPLKFKRDPSVEKDPGLVLTVGTMNQMNDFVNKGFDLFADAARSLPSFRFVLIGIKKEFLPWAEEKYRLSEIPNLTLVPHFCPDEVLINYYNRAKVFVQASITEGMPNTLCEAMLMGCIPVGSDVNGIPDVIGDTGVIVRNRDSAELVRSIHRALELNGNQSNQRALLSFTFADRAKKIKLALQNL